MEGETAMADNVVLSEDAGGGVALITLNRPDRLNAWTTQLEREYFDALAAADADRDVRAVVVTGAGRGFCAGADMDMLQGIGEAGGRRRDGATEAREHRASTFPLGIDKPLIGAINGACAGIGFVHALMFDVRFAAAGAKFTTAFARRGLIAEHGASWLLPRLVGTSRALDLLLSARVVLAEEALEMGLVNRVLPGEALVEEAVAYARDLAANCSPASMAIIKRQIHDHADADLAAALAESDAYMARTLSGPDFKEGVASFVERRAPDFAPLGEGTPLP